MRNFFFTAFAISFLALSSLTFAQVNYQEILPVALDQLAAYYPDGRILAEIKTNAGEIKSYSIVTSGGKVAQFNEGKLENPNYVLSTTQSALENIASSPNPTLQVLNALTNGEIKVTSASGESVLDRIKSFFLGMLDRIFSIFRF